MTAPAYQADGLTVYGGDCRQILAELPAESVHAVVTSPPYWGLRDYGHGGQIGLEGSPDAYVAELVDVFREVRRVLRPEGTVWLNLGDSYAGAWGAQSRGSEARSASTLEAGLRTQGRTVAGDTSGRRHGVGGAVKPKDLVGIPWRVAFALQADGWFLRCDVVWSKPNPMPESVTDRPTRSHEYLFQLTKQARYFFDAEAVREPALWPDGANSPSSITSPYGQGFTRRAVSDRSRRTAEWRDRQERDVGGRTDGFTRIPGGEVDWLANGRSGRNIRSVWTIATVPYPGAHFATFPTKLVEPCVKASTSERGVCPECGAPWTRVVDRRTVSATPRGTEPSQSRANLKPPQQSQIVSSAETLGWQPSCSHGREADDWAVIRTPTGAGGLEDATKTRGRRGLGRARADDEGARPMYRWQQRGYARQLRDSEFAPDMRADVGHTTFDHYTRTDPAGARAIPPDLLERWTSLGWLTEPEEPAKPTEPLVPAVVLDPFAGSGTTGRVALELGRRAILIDLNPEYVRQAIVRASHGYADPGGQDVPADSLWAGVE